MIELLNLPQALPFTVALALVALLAAVEIASVVIAGSGASGILDGFLPDTEIDIDHPSGSGLETVLGWLKVGEVPIMMIVISFLIIFGVVGLILQWIVIDTSGAPIDTPLAVVFALPLSLPLLRGAVLGLDAVIPGDETEAIARDHLVGLTGSVVIGTAAKGSPAEAKVHTEHGQTHYVMVEPEDGEAPIAQGQSLRITERRGPTYLAVLRTPSDPG